VSTNLCELTETLEDEGLLFTYPVGDPEALAGAILSLEADRERLRATGERLKRFVLDNYSYEATTGALREWVKDPHNSPDFSKRWRTRLEMLQNAKKVFTPPITADSPAMEKIRFYIRSEGVVRTVRRSMKFVGKKESDGEE